MCPKGKKSSLKFFYNFSFFCRKKNRNFNLCLSKHQLLHCNIFYIYKYTVKNVLGEIRNNCYGFCQLQVYNGNIIIFIRAL